MTSPSPTPATSPPARRIALALSGGGYRAAAFHLGVLQVLARLEILADVGILSTASDFNPCHKTAPQVAEAISRGVRMAGALPFVFPTVSLHEAF